MKHKGQTLNERLIFSGQLKQFELALRNQNKLELVSILKSLDIDNPDVEFILKNTKLDRRNIFHKFQRKYLK